MDIREYLQNFLSTDLLEDKDQIQEQFKKVAEFILNNLLITVDDREYQVTEVEFYYHRKGIHEDPFIHKHDNQKKMGLWYFHDVGQDITFGDGESYGGILIRGIKDTHSDEFADGPVKVFNKLFNDSQLNINDRHSFEVKLSGSKLLSDNHVIYSFPRAGLQPTREKQGITYLLAPYRYLSFPEFSGKEWNVIYFYLRYVYLIDVPEEILKNGATIRYYDDQFRMGKEMSATEYQHIIDGDVKMSVTNKCRLLGYYFKDSML